MAWIKLQRGMHMYRSILLATLAIGGASAGSAAAAPEDRPVLSAGIENDLFGVTGTDRYYTHGTRFAFRHGTDSAPFWRGALDWAPLLPRGARMSYETGLLQLIFTPSSIRGREVRPGDRPYAGMLAGTIAIDGTALDGRRSDQISLTVGLIGPASLAEQAQKLVHRVQQGIEPRGWQTQLGTEPAVNLGWRRRWAYAAPGMAVSPHIGAALGNVHTHAAAGVTLAIGAGLANQRPAELEPFSPGLAALPASPRPVLNLLAGVEGRVVARNLFLAGNSFTDGRGVDTKPLVGDAFAGASLRWRGLRLSFRHVWRSKEFVGQRGIQRFGGFTLDLRV